MKRFVGFRASFCLRSKRPIELTAVMPLAQRGQFLFVNYRICLDRLAYRIRPCRDPYYGRVRWRRLLSGNAGSSASRLTEVAKMFGSLWFVRWLGPVFRLGRNPAVSLLLGRKIPDMRGRPISSLDRNGPTAVLDHFRVKFWFIAHHFESRKHGQPGRGRFACRPCRPRYRRKPRPKNQSSFQGKVPYCFSRETVAKPFSLLVKNC
jgi:hypothetical protein